VIDGAVGPTFVKAWKWFWENSPLLICGCSGMVGFQGTSAAAPSAVVCVSSASGGSLWFVLLQVLLLVLLLLLLLLLHLLLCKSVSAAALFADTCSFCSRLRSPPWQRFKVGRAASA
jgi:hypothetical protein